MMLDLVSSSWIHNKRQRIWSLTRLYFLSQVFLQFIQIFLISLENFLSIIYKCLTQQADTCNLVQINTNKKVHMLEISFTIKYQILVLFICYIQVGVICSFRILEAVCDVSALFSFLVRNRGCSGQLALILTYFPRDHRGQ